MWVYLVKISCYNSICFSLLVFSILFEMRTAFVGVVVLLCLMVFRNGSEDPHRTIYDAFGFVLYEYDCMSAFSNRFHRYWNAVKCCGTGCVGFCSDAIIHSCLINLRWFLGICCYMVMMLREKAIRCD